jgi:hypothetical protein
MKYFDNFWLGSCMCSRVELLPGFEFTGKMVKIMEFTGKIGKTGKW